jgi:glutamate synthase domain-containing protein 3
VRELVEKHRMFTSSAVAKDVLERWEQVLPQFVKVMPIDYKLVLQKKGDLSMGVPRPESVPPLERAADSVAE